MCDGMPQDKCPVHCTKCGWRGERAYSFDDPTQKRCPKCFGQIVRGWISAAESREIRMRNV